MNKNFNGTEIKDPEIKFKTFLQEAQALRAKVPKIDADHLEDIEYLLPTE